MDRKEHNKIAKLLLGDDFNELNEFMDRPSKVFGPNHRVLFHDPFFVALVAAKDGPKAGAAAALHIVVDTVPPAFRPLVKKILSKQ